MKEAKPSEGKRVHPLTKIGYFLLTQGNRYANSFILLAGFALSGAFFVLGVNYVAPAFSYASRVNEALRQALCVFMPVLPGNYGVLRYGGHKND